MKQLILIAVTTLLFMSCEKPAMEDDPSFGYTDSFKVEIIKDQAKGTNYPTIVIQSPTTPSVPQIFDLSVIAWDKSQIDQVIMTVNGQPYRDWKPTASVKDWSYTETIDLAPYFIKFIHFKVVNNKRLSSEVWLIASMIAY